MKILFGSEKLRERPRLLRYALALVSVALAAAGTFVLLHTVGRTPAIGYLYLFAIMASAWWGGFGPGILACFLTFFTAPLLLTPNFTPAQVDKNRLALTVLVAVAISWVRFGRQRAEQSIGESKAQLEQRVAERTERLSIAVQSLENEIRATQQAKQELRKSEQRLLTQYGVARILARATDLSSAAPQILQTIGENLGYQAGLLWRPGSNGTETLECVESWYQHATELTAFDQISREKGFVSGVGLPGRIWATREPAWITDLRADINFPRITAATDLGLKSAFGFPVLQGENICGVMEFFTTETRTWDPELLKMAAGVGLQIGQFLERKQAEKELLSRDESYRVLTETASDGIVSIDEQGKILFANTAAARIFGHTTEELVGGDLTVLMPEYLRHLHRAAVTRYLGTGRRHISWQAVQLPGLHKDGHEIPLEVSFVDYQQDGRHKFTGIIRDVTERKRYEEQLRHTAKLESVGVLAGGIAHDFNNLLTGILGNSSLAFDTLPPENPARGMIREVISASERASHLTRQLLAYAGKGRFLVEPLNLSKLVREITNLIRASIPKTVHVRLKIQDELPAIDADASQLQQVIMNLVINAAEAIQEGESGSVLVTTGVQEVDEAYIRTTFAVPERLTPGRYVFLEVHDTGIGMDQATIDRIFDPFFTTKFTGRGLGLAAVMGIIRGYHGALKVYSTPGRGSTFKLLFPVSTQEISTATPPLERVPPAGTGTVLVIDDEDVVRRIASTTLEQYGYRVIVAEDGHRGIELCRQTADVGIVLLDLTMPGLSGEEILRELKQIRPTAKVVLSSGYNEMEIVERFAGKGLAAFIQKPYTAAALARTVASVLSGDGKLVH